MLLREFEVKQRFHFGGGGGVFGVVGEIVPFVGIVVVIVEFDAGLAFVPFDVAPAFGADAAAHAFVFVAGDLGVGGSGPGFIAGFNQQRTEGSAFEVGGRFK